MWEDLALVAVVAHVVLAPFSKVEESFNTQAVHDLLFAESFGDWDHHQYPGTVPRTFLGAIAVAGAYKVGALLHAPVAALCPLASSWALRRVAGSSRAGAAPLLGAQVACRLALALLWSAGFRRFAGGARVRFGDGAAKWLCAFTAAQFHGAFYAARLLPNSLAMPLVLAAYGEALRGRRGRGLALLAAAACAFRCDVAAVAVPLGLVWCLWPGLPGRAPLFAVGAPATLLGAGLAVGLSVAVDSKLWTAPGAPHTKWLWPEGAVLLFNNPVDNRSAAWGVEPWHWYASSALPRSLGGALPLAVLASATDPRRVVPELVAPAVASLALLSLLPHKELRFAFPALPLLTLAAAVAAEGLARSDGGKKKDDGGRSPFFFRNALRLVPFGLLALTLAATALFATAARHNYPGGVALRALHDDFGYDLGHRAAVHIDDKAATTGASRFGEELRDAGWTYDKTDGLQDFDAFDFRLAEWPLDADPGAFDVVLKVDAYAGLRVDRANFPRVVAVATAPAVAVLRHRRHRGPAVAEPRTVTA